jgi:hypothetical protein
MVVIGVLLTFIILIGLAGMSGIGVHDSRDTSYGLHGTPRREPRYPTDNRVAAIGAHRGLSAVWADVVYAHHRLAVLNRPWLAKDAGARRGWN